MNEILVQLEFNQGTSATNGATHSSFTHMCPATYKGGNSGKLIHIKNTISLN